MTAYPDAVWSIRVPLPVDRSKLPLLRPKVRGNLRDSTPRQLRPTDVSSTSTTISNATGSYDPCLSTTYSVKNQSIKEEFNGQYQNTAYGAGKPPEGCLLTADKKTCIVYLPKEPFQDSAERGEC